VQRRRGAQLLALGSFLLLAGGLSLGVWGQYSQQQQVMETARQQRDFVLSVHVATVEAGPGTVSITLPGTTAAFAQPTSLPAQPAISLSAMSTSGIMSGQEICWHSSQYRNSMTRFRRTRRCSIS
jgi:hypothetical protein